MPVQCPTPEEMIHQFIDGELSKTCRKVFATMLKDDPEIKEELAAYTRLVAALKAFRRVKYPPDKLRQARTAIMERISTAA